MAKVSSCRMKLGLLPVVGAVVVVVVFVMVLLQKLPAGAIPSLVPHFRAHAAFPPLKPALVATTGVMDRGYLSSMKIPSPIKLRQFVTLSTPL